MIFLVQFGRNKQFCLSLKINKLKPVFMFVRTLMIKLHLNFVNVVVDPQDSINLFFAMSTIKKG